MFGAVAAAGGVYCWAALPETKGRSLAEVQALLAVDKAPLAASDELARSGSEPGDASNAIYGGAAPYPALLATGALLPIAASAQFMRAFCFCASCHLACL